MGDDGPILVTGAAGQLGSVGRTGTQVVVGDLLELAVAALGLICYGLYFILQVRYRRL